MRLYQAGDSESGACERHVKINKAVKICSEDSKKLGLARMLYMDADKIVIARLGMISQNFRS